tara:strand:+ start:1031 stop:1642 length:612 start_codon:yes stop_codon:yes gene_type:complete
VIKMSYITKTSKVVMTDIESLTEALELSDCTFESTSKEQIRVSAAGRTVTINKSGNGFWSYRYEEYTSMDNFNTWFRQLEKKYSEVVREKIMRVEAEKKRQRELAKEADNLREKAARTQVELDSKSRSKLSELENNIAQSKLALDEAQRRLDTVEKSKKEYRSATELELKKRAEKGGWNLARDVHDSSRRVSRIRWTRKKVSN